MRVATAPTVLASMAPLSTLTSREGQARLFSRRRSRRRASSTTRIASTPAAMAAASGNRDGSGPISGTGAGPATGFGRAATVDLACAAVSFAASPCEVAVGVRQLRRWRLLGWRLLRRQPSSRPSWRARLSWRPWPVRSSRPSWQARSSQPWPAVSAPEVGVVRGQAGRHPHQVPTSPIQRPEMPRQAFRRVDPAGLPSGCSFAPSSSCRQWVPSCQVAYGANR